MQPRYDKLNVGCGRDLRDGWVNLDRKLMGTQTAAFEFCRFNLEDIGKRHGLIPYSTGSFSEIAVSHLLEHLSNPLDVMEELWRVAAPECRLQVNIPHGATDDAWEDQTHQRVYYEGSWQAFGQPYYWRADYGYRGDWRCEEVVLVVEPALLASYDLDNAMQMIRRGRNFVYEMIAVLRATKPARPQERSTEPEVLNVVLVPAGGPSDVPESDPPPSMTSDPAIDLSGPVSSISGERIPQFSPEGSAIVTRSPS